MATIPTDMGFELTNTEPLDPRLVREDIAARDALVTNLQAYEGMEVYVKSEKKKYKYTGTTWEEIGSGSGASYDDSEVRGLINTNKTDITELTTKIGNETLTTTSQTITGSINELFQSVSNGKQLIASAITDKGVETLADATFETIAENISNIEAGDLSAIYSALNKHGLGVSGKEDEEKIAKIIQDLLTLAHLSQDTGIVEDFTDSTDNTIHENAFIEGVIGKILIEPKELLFVDNTDYIEFEEITKSEYTTSVLLNRR